MYTVVTFVQYVVWKKIKFIFVKRAWTTSRPGCRPQCRIVVSSSKASDDARTNAVRPYFLSRKKKNWTPARGETENTWRHERPKIGFTVRRTSGFYGEENGQNERAKNVHNSGISRFRFEISRTGIGRKNISACKLLKTDPTKFVEISVKSYGSKLKTCQQVGTRIVRHMTRRSGKNAWDPTDRERVT